MFKQNGETTQTAKCVKNVIQANFSDERVILRISLFTCPTKSPDLNPCDFQLWGLLKYRVYEGRVTNKADLKGGIVRLTSLVPTDMLHAAIDSVVICF